MIRHVCVLTWVADVAPDHLAVAREHTAPILAGRTAGQFLL